MIIMLFFTFCTKFVRNNFSFKLKKMSVLLLVADALYFTDFWTKKDDFFWGGGMGGSEPPPPTFFMVFEAKDSLWRMGLVSRLCAEHTNAHAPIFSWILFILLPSWRAAFFLFSSKNVLFDFSKLTWVHTLTKSPSTMYLQAPASWFTLSTWKTGCIEKLLAAACLLEEGFLYPQRRFYLPLIFLLFFTALGGSGQRQTFFLCPLPPNSLNYGYMWVCVCVCVCACVRALCMYFCVHICVSRRFLAKS